MSEIGQENQQFELGAPAMFEIQILFHLVSNVHHRLFKIYKKVPIQQDFVLYVGIKIQ